MFQLKAGILSVVLPFGKSENPNGETKDDVETNLLYSMHEEYINFHI